jgi:hypothetical protein
MRPDIDDTPTKTRPDIALLDPQLAPHASCQQLEFSVQLLALTRIKH